MYKFFTIENPPFKECGTRALSEEVDVFNADIFLFLPAHWSQAAALKAIFNCPNIFLRPQGTVDANFSGRSVSRPKARRESLHPTDLTEGETNLAQVHSIFILYFHT